MDRTTIAAIRLDSKLGMKLAPSHLETSFFNRMTTATP
jgi:hypothetical protein